MRLVAPFHPNMSTASLTALTPGSRQGYLYVSENDPTDDTDDVLQFTINMGSGNTGLSLFNNPAAGNYLYGRGLFLVPQWQSGTNYAAGAVVRPLNPSLNAGFAYKNEGAGTLTSGATEPTWPTTIGNTVGDGGGTWTTIACPLDQPDGDDEQIVFANGSPTLNPPGGSPNNTGASQFAEITYFLRHGNLYRRVLLIRQPYDPTTGFTNAQPNDGTAAPSPLIPNAYPPYPAGAGSGNFWTDFDYSARISTGNHPGVNFLTNGNGGQLSGQFGVGCAVTDRPARQSFRIRSDIPPPGYAACNDPYDFLWSASRIRVPVQQHREHGGWKRSGTVVFLRPLYARRNVESKLSVPRQPAACSAWHGDAYFANGVRFAFSDRFSQLHDVDARRKSAD